MSHVQETLRITDSPLLSCIAAFSMLWYKYPDIHCQQITKDRLEGSPGIYRRHFSRTGLMTLRFSFFPPE